MTDKHQSRQSSSDALLRGHFTDGYTQFTVYASIPQEPDAFHVYREPAVFREVATDHPLTASEYRIECNDGAGPRVICRFFNEPDQTPEWFGAWRGDPWCPWILKRAFALVADPENT